MRIIAQLVRVALVALLCSSAACYHLTYSSALPRSGERHQGTNHFFLFGLAGRSEVNLEAACPSGVSRLHVYQTFGDGFLRILTLGIYTPRTYEVWCAARSAGDAS